MKKKIKHLVKHQVTYLLIVVIGIMIYQIWDKKHAFETVTAMSYGADYSSGLWYKINVDNKGSVILPQALYDQLTRIENKGKKEIKK